MIVELRQRVAVAARGAVAAVTGLEVELPTVEDPPRPEFGDLAVPVALEVGRRLGEPPRQVAERLLAWLEDHPVEGVARWTIAGPGYLNALLDRGRLLGALVELLERPARPAAGDKVIVEHTSINPNKAAHIGHLRNAVLGDTLVRLLRWQGLPVEVHNYIDDTGVQVADVVLGLVDLRDLDAAGVAAIEEPFDYYCWDLYTQVTERLEADAALGERRREVLLRLERGTPPEAEVAEVVVERIVRRHLRTMGRLGIEYELLVREGDVVALDLWSEAFERLKATDQVYLAESGKNAGCWMMRLEGVAGFEDLEEADKVLVRSNGTATYVAKDIAYHMWKYGVLDRDFLYVPFIDKDGAVVWRSSRDQGEERPFGRARRGITVIDVRQAYLQAIVATALELFAGSEEEARPAEGGGEPPPEGAGGGEPPREGAGGGELRREGAGGRAREQERNAGARAGPHGRHVHFAYEMVALTPATARSLGIPVSEADEARAFVEMSGRRGTGVKADDLLDALEERATDEVRQRNPELPPAERRELGRQIAVAAARYFLVRFARNTVIAFDLEEALSFEGETGPYLQYAAVRAGSIFDKMSERWGVDAERAVGLVRGAADVGDESPVARLDLPALGELLEQADNEGLWGLVLTLAQLERVVQQSVESLEIAGLAKYAFGLAQQFSRFYHTYPILQEEDRRERGLRLLVAWVFRARLAQALDLLGMPLPDRM